jgi:hypothetical protein
MRFNSQIKAEYKPGVLDDLFLNLFRNKLVKVVFLNWSGIRIV